MASNPVPAEESSCRYMDGTQHIDIAAELYNIGYSVEEVNRLIQLTGGHTYIPEQVPEQILAPEYTQFSIPEDKQLPTQDYNKLSVAEDEQLPTQDYNKLSVPEDEQLPTQDYNKLSVPEDEQLPTQDYNENSIPEYEQLSTFADANNSYEMSPSYRLPATPDNSSPSTPFAEGDANMNYQMPSSYRLPQFNNPFTFAKPTAPAPKASLRLGKRATEGLKQWHESYSTNSNSRHPYPTDEATRMLARTYNITPRQVKKWFARKRQRNRKPKTEPAPTMNTTNDINYDFSHLLSAFE